MGVRVVFPDMGKDPSVQLIEKTITGNGTYDAITDGANGYSKVNVNVEGGGGSSDFSTAEVTITNNSGNEIKFYAPFYNAEYKAIQSFMWTDTEEPTINSTIIVPTSGMVFVGAEGLAQFTPQNTATTGNATVENGELVITGDCTITIS